MFRKPAVSVGDLQPSDIFTTAQYDYAPSEQLGSGRSPLDYLWPTENPITKATSHPPLNAATMQQESKDVFSYYGEHLQYVMNDPIWNPCGFEGCTIESASTGPVTFSNTAASVIRVAAFAAKTNENTYTYRYTIENHDFDQRISRLFIASPSPASDMSVYRNGHTDSEAGYDVKTCEWTMRNVEGGIVVELVKTGTTVACSYTASYEERQSFMSMPIGGFSVFAFEFSSTSKPAVSTMQARNYEPLTMDDEMTTMYGRGSTYTTVSPGIVDLNIHTIVPMIDEFPPSSCLDLKTYYQPKSAVRNTRNRTDVFIPCHSPSCEIFKCRHIGDKAPYPKS